MYVLPIVLSVVGGLALYVWVALALQFVLRKAGEPGWQAWVPIVNTIVVLRLGGFSGWWVLLAFVPIANIAFLVVLIMAYHRINVAFDYGAGMTVLAVFLGPIWLSVLAWGTAEWLGHDDPPAGTVQPPAQLHDRFSGPLLGMPEFATLAPDPPQQALAHPFAPTPVPTPIPPVAPPAAASPPLPPAPPAPEIFASEAPAAGVPATEPPAPPAPAPVSAASTWGPPAPSAAPVSSVPDDLNDTSGEVSAVFGAPSLGEPRSASGAVSALWRLPDAGAGSPASGIDADDDLDAVEQTVVAQRRRTIWQVTPPAGAPIVLTADVVVLGRRPSPDPAHPTAQLIAVVDDTRTMSKTHARLQRHEDTWTVTDLGSTNGVFLLRDDGTEIEVLAGAPQPVRGRFLLGDAELVLDVR